MLADDPLAVADLPLEADAHLLNTVPSAAAELAGGGHLPATVRVVNVAGEALSQGVIQRLAAAGVRTVNNLYGPTETCVYSTAAIVTSEDCDVPIGRPLPGETVYLLDERLRAVPVGVVGAAGDIEGAVVRAGRAAGRVHLHRVERAQG